MNSIIETFPYLMKFNKIHAQISDELFISIKNAILCNYGSIKKYSVQIGINKHTLKWEFKKNVYHPCYRLLKISHDVSIPESVILRNITGFYHWGSRIKKAVKIPRFLYIDKFFVEGYALYLAEGNTGFNGKTRPRGFTFTNSEEKVINNMIKWIQTYFPDIPVSIIAINPIGKNIDKNLIKSELNYKNIKFKEGFYNKKIKYRLNVDRAIFIDLILSIEKEIKEICARDIMLARAYIRGMMIGEGTVYNKRMRYIRLEMKNSDEIKFIMKLLKNIGITYSHHKRNKRPGMEIVYIGGKTDIKKFYDLVGFGCHDGRQKILNQIVHDIISEKE